MSIWVDKLLSWFADNKRPLPWRKDRDPYRVWVSEIMLQQTRIEAVMDYYARFMQAFPTVQDLAAAPIEKVLKLWEGLGYYSRARNLHKTAVKVAEMGSFPKTYEELRRLPGIGEYTAGAIAAIAFGEPVCAIDGNVMRVVSRLYALEQDVLLPAAKKNVEVLLNAEYPKDRASDFVQGLMELGELICLPQSPKCEICPVQALCKARAEGRETSLPVRLPRTKQKAQERVVFILVSAGRVLLTKRDEKGVLGGLWEYPNVEAGALEEALPILKEEYGLEATEMEYISRVTHVFTHIRWQMAVYKGKAKDDVNLAALRRPYIWADVDALEEEVMLPTAFRKIKWRD